MPVTDRREPAVYVSIEDASYAAPALELGRVGYVATICDCGEHNKILTLTSRDEFHKKLGKPNFRKTSQAHYLIDKFLQYSNKCLVVRVMPDDAYLSNSIIEESSASEKIMEADDLTEALFTFISAVNTYVWQKNYSYTIGDIATVPDITNYIYIAETNGTTGSSRPSWPVIPSTTVVDGTITWRCELNPYNIITCSNLESYDAVAIGTWIFAQDDSPSNAAQVVSKSNVGGYFLTIDRNYDGTAPIGPPCQGFSCDPYYQRSQTDVTSVASFNTLSSTVVWYFYAKGAGSYYNNIRLKGVRNIQMEKMYTDDDGNVLYPYLFMDVGIYYVNDDETETLLEGPWTVSLIRRTKTGSIIRDITSGQVLYIEDVINQSSNFLGIISAEGINQLVNAIDADERRLEVMLILSITGTTVTSAGNIAFGGLIFENGKDGTVDVARTKQMYDVDTGYLETDNDYLMSLVTQAYNGTLTSTDGSVEQIPECVYPWYDIDYILTGGYPAEVQYGGRTLADIRQDCIHLADTGSLITSFQNDITARLEDVDWNNWTSMLYVQYRRIFDTFTGEYLWINPVYHAIERHLYCDAIYFLAEPVAGIEKGAINERIELAYKGNHTQRGDLQDKNLNMVIVEPQGKYILTQLTTCKRLSVLQRGHVAKFVAYIRKEIPKLLKDILQRRATSYWIGQSQYRVSEFLSKFLESGVERYSVLKNFTVSVIFDDARNELNVYIDITPIRSIEKINVFIIVH